MSYDLQIWSVHPFEQAFMGSRKGGGRSSRNDYTFSGKGWQIVINSSDKILPEDIEPQISSTVPGIRYLTELNLEGKATKETFKLLHSTAKAIAKSMHGVVLDPQSDQITTPSGVTRFIPPKKEKTFSVLNLSWWFLNDVLLKENGIRL